MVGKPFIIILVAACFLGASRGLQFGWPHRVFQPRPLLVAGIAWGIYGLWEGLVLLFTPKANIRVDLLVIWPVLAVLSLWSLLRVFRSFR